tara:strand:+ start:480 stop:1058 length:579 start_codon:yes stop_codon:yes gene_type:complete
MVTSKHEISYSYKKNWIKRTSNNINYWINDTNKLKDINCIICNKLETISKKCVYNTCSKKCTAKAIENEFIRNWINGKNKKSWSHKRDNRPSNYIYNYFFELHKIDLEINRITPCCKVEIPTAWNGSKSFMELNHINHDYLNNSFENLELICANCHAGKTKSWLDMKNQGLKGRFAKNTNILKQLKQLDNNS